MNIFKPLFQIFGICLHDWSEYSDIKTVNMRYVIHSSGQKFDYVERRQYRFCLDCNYSEYRVVR